MRRRRSCILLCLVAIPLGFQLYYIASYLASGSGFGHERVGVFKWNREPDERWRSLLNASRCVDVRPDLGPVPSRYLRKPEVTSLLLNATFSGNGECKHYEEYDASHRFRLLSDTKVYFKENGNHLCLIEGTSERSSSGCHCVDGWHGRSCSIPSSVWYATDLPSPLRVRIKPRYQESRRIIYGFAFNTEFAMLEARLAEFGDIVDVFLILESNYTAYGQPKPYRLLQVLCQGKYREYVNKIVHVRLEYFPPSAYTNGWIADALHRNYISQHGLKDLIHGYKQDDLVIITDADELPSRDTVLFLKLHTGYPEPVAHSYTTTTYGFFWEHEQYIALPSTVSIGILTRVLEWKAYSVRKGMSALTAKRAVFFNYVKSHKDAQLWQWTFGNRSDPAGWHCSWCFDPEGIRNKLLSAQNGDFPRWGDFPEKRNLSYIRRLTRKGEWFDGKTKFTPRPCNTRNYAPKYLLVHYNEYSSLLSYGRALSKPRME